MSCYNWEKGTIKVPAGEFARFRRRVVDYINDQFKLALVKALSLYEDIIKHKLTVEQAKERLAKMHLTSEIEYLIGKALYPKIEFSLFEKPGYISPRHPKVKDFPFAALAATKFENDECRLTFHKDGNEVIWTVPENNRAVEHAADSVLGRAFYKGISAVNFTSRSGGTIVGNDEYNHDDRNVGGGGNYVTHSYGGIGKREKHDAWASRRRKAVGSR